MIHFIFASPASFPLGTENGPQEWVLPQHVAGGASVGDKLASRGDPLGFQGPTWPLMVAILAFSAFLSFVIVMLQWITGPTLPILEACFPLAASP